MRTHSLSATVAAVGLLFFATAGLHAAILEDHFAARIVGSGSYNPDIGNSINFDITTAGPTTAGASAFGVGVGNGYQEAMASAFANSALHVGDQFAGLSTTAYSLNTLPFYNPWAPAGKATALAAWNEIAGLPNTGTLTFEIDVHSILKGNPAATYPYSLSQSTVAVLARPGVFDNTSDLVYSMNSYMNYIYGNTVTLTFDTGFSTSVSGDWSFLHVDGPDAITPVYGTIRFDVPYDETRHGYAFNVFFTSTTYVWGGTATADSLNTLRLARIVRADGSPIDLSTVRFDSGIQIGAVPEPTALLAWSAFSCLGLLCVGRKRRG